MICRVMRLLRKYLLRKLSELFFLRTDSTGLFSCLFGGLWACVGFPCRAKSWLFLLFQWIQGDGGRRRLQC